MRKTFTNFYLLTTPITLLFISYLSRLLRDLIYASIFPFLMQYLKNQFLQQIVLIHITGVNAFALHIGVS